MLNLTDRRLALEEPVLEQLPSVVVLARGLYMPVFENTGGTSAT